ncbi:MAG: hypothetical protein DWQ11_02920 [Proteobacteria bacterium]|nr:MAG: hypothetical protein DWQ11_02920 [Pseudomonadota bacterium]
MRFNFKVKQELAQAIEQRFQCEHDERQLRLRTIADGRRAYYRQCVRCGHAGNAVSARAALRDLAGNSQPPLFDDELEPKWRAKKHAAYVAAYTAARSEIKKEYGAYLRSVEWAQRRLLVLRRANWVCEICEYFDAKEVHHVTYERVGHERDADLMAVCPFCHGLLHERRSS